jgi:hypothetical protein
MPAACKRRYRPEPAAPRLGIAVIGQGAAAHDEPLFRRLRAHGGYFSQVNPEHGLETLLSAVAAWAKRIPPLCSLVH